MAWQEAFRDHGYPIDQEKIRTQIGKGADQLIPALLPAPGEQIRKAMAGSHDAIFSARYLKQVKPFPHATDIVEMVYAKGKQVVLASSAGKKELEHYTELLKITTMLSGTVSSDDVANSKPAGDVFAAALAKVFPVAAGETLAIGDTPYDVESALRSNIKTIGLRSGGFSGQTLAEAGAAFVYASVKELFDGFDVSPLNS